MAHPMHIVPEASRLSKNRESSALMRSAVQPLKRHRGAQDSQDPHPLDPLDSTVFCRNEGNKNTTRKKQAVAAQEYRIAEAWLL